MSTETIGVHHIAIAVSNFEVSKKFYDRVMGHLGLQPAIQATGAPHKETDGKVCIYASKTTMFAIWSVDKQSKGNKWHFYNIGLHHLAFGAPTRNAVDEFHEKLKKEGVEIIDPPKEYGYVPGFYAVYFKDPDGIKLEFAYTPH